MADRHTDHASVARLTWTAPGHRAVIYVSGDIDRPDAERLVKLAATALAHATALEVDLRDVGVFGSDAADAVVRIQAIGARAAVPIRLKNQPRHVDRVLDVLNILNVHAQSATSVCHVHDVA